MDLDLDLRVKRTKVSRCDTLGSCVTPYNKNNMSNKIRRQDRCPPISVLAIVIPDSRTIGLNHVS